MKQFAIIAVACIALGLAGSAAARDIEYPLIGVPEAFTLVNLHPDESSRQLYSVNYQLAGLIPLCTKVRIVSVTHRKMVFQLSDGGREYEYLFHDTLKEPIPKHLDRFFGNTCNKQKVDALGSVDREGILQGRVLPGMTKEGVILAVGYPPDHATPNLEAGAWKYWRNRFATTLVHFEQGKVVRIE